MITHTNGNFKTITDEMLKLCLKFDVILEIKLHTSKFNYHMFDGWIKSDGIIFKTPLTQSASTYVCENCKRTRSIFGCLTDKNIEYFCLCSSFIEDEIMACFI